MKWEMGRQCDLLRTEADIDEQACQHKWDPTKWEYKGDYIVYRLWTCSLCGASQTKRSPNVTGIGDVVEKSVANLDGNASN